MALIIVTTGSEDNNSADAVISLREALAMAEASAGADTIVFGAGVSLVSLGAGPLVISSGAGVTISGDKDGDGIADVTISGQNATRILTVRAGAVATLESVNLVDGADIAGNGSGGPDGSHGAAGFDGPAGGNSGGNGQNGAHGSNGTTGADAAGAIFNSGDLTLIRVGLAGNSAQGGNGGFGGDGGNGGNGGRGQNGINGTPMDGGSGGSGGSGGNGGNGGDGGKAAGAIFNAAGATLTLQDTGFGDVVVTGGIAGNFGSNSGHGGGGGHGGQGGIGGNGGNGGNGASTNYTPGNGGNGGSAGSFGFNGAGGNGGSAVGAIANFGTINVTGGAAISLHQPANQALAGQGGSGGYYGFPLIATGGREGTGGTSYYFGVGGAAGQMGNDSESRYPGADGSYGVERPGLLGTAPTGGAVADSIVYVHGSNLVIAEGDGGGTTSFTFNINRTGDLSEAVQVSWTLSGLGGLNAADFVGGVLPSGTVTLAANDATEAVTFDVMADDQTELDENFTITLSNLVDAVGGATHSLGTSQVNGTIVTDDTVFALFADATSTSPLLTNNDFATLDAAATPGQVIRVLDPSSFGATAPSLTVTANDITVSADTAFAVNYTLGAGVTKFTVMSPGTSSADSAQVLCNALANIVQMGDGFNLIGAGAGDDTLTGGGGNDSIDGGGDSDTVVYTGAWSDYRITFSASTFVITDQRAGSPDGVDSVYNVEFFTFANGTFTAADILNDAPVGVNDDNSADAVTEAGGVADAISGDPLATGNVLTNDTDADSTLGDKMAVAGARTGTETAGGPLTVMAGIVTLTGIYGSIVIAANGDYTYTLDNADADTLALADGAIVTDVFTYLMYDARGRTDLAQLTVSITGSNDAPVITSDAGGATAAVSVAENTTAVTTVTANDVDTGATQTYSLAAGGADNALFTIDSATGALAFVSGRNFEAPTDAGTDNVYDVQVRVSDGTLAAVQNIEVTVTDSALGVTIVGSAGDDVVSTSLTVAGQPFATDEADVISGLSGNDDLNGDQGDDEISGGTGTDTINGGTGTDTMSGGADSDWYFIDSSSDVVIEGEFDGTADRVLTSAAYTLAAGSYVEQLTTKLQAGLTAINLTGNDIAQTITGNAGTNVLIGAGGDDTLFGLAGEDTLSGGTGTDSMRGGADNDWYFVDSSTDVVIERELDGTADRVLASASYTLAANAYVEHLTTNLQAGLTAINLTGNDIAQTITGNAGTNVLIGAGGDDTLFGLAGEDTLSGGTGTDSMRGGADSDWYLVDSSTDVVIERELDGTADRVLASASYALAANAYVEHLTTNLQAGLTAINLTGNDIAQTITGNAGTNVLIGAGGDDTLFGLAGEDTLSGGTGTDSMRGGADSDWYLVDSSTDVVIERELDGTADRVLASASYALAANAYVEHLTTNLQAGLTAINLTGNDIAQTITGNAGTNVLIGAGGDDTLFGLAGEDTLSGGTGTDSMRGGADSDWYLVDSSTDVVIERELDGTADRVLALTSYTLAANAYVEHLTTTLQAGLTAINLTGNDIAQTITGNAGTNVLIGAGGDDTLFGLAGEDTLSGGTGTDSMRGGADSDWYLVDSSTDVVIERELDGTADRVLASASYALAANAYVEHLTTTLQAGLTAINLTGNGIAQTITGNAGTNVLNGGGGNDTMSGLAGLDSFVFNTALGSSNVDRILDFSVADDTIQLDQAVFATLSAGGLEDAAFTSNLTGAATTALQRIIYESDTGNLFYDADGNAAGVGAAQFATLTTGLGLTVADFLVI